MKHFVLILIAIGFVGFVGCTSGDDQANDSESASDAVLCEWDSDEQASLATELSFGVEQSGFICPIGDEDWYSFNTSAGEELVTVSLVVDGLLSPIDPSYVIYDASGENIVAAPDAADAAGPDDLLKVTHAVAPGDHRLRVVDRGADAQDTRHAYMLTVEVTAEPDSNEPNDELAAATGISEGNDATGYISFGGDEDWYSFTASPDYVVRASLTMPIGAIQPLMRIIDSSGQVLGELANFDGSREATDIELLQALQDGGTYYIVISDDNLAQTDVDVAYTLSIQLLLDPDHANEPNNHPSTATTLNAVTCGGSWSGTPRTAFIGSQGDVDWYRLPLSNCQRGVVEVEVTHGGAVPADLNYTVRIVRAVDGESCSLDQECQVLSPSCTEHMQCTRIGNTCLAEGRCGGAGLCLPGAECGAVLLSETAHPATPGTLKLSAPLLTDLDLYSEIYIAVADAGGNAYDMTNSYTMTARVIEDPDTQEDASVYTAGAAAYDDNIGAHRADAQFIPYHDTRGGGPGCDTATFSNFVPGYLSYLYDQDWFEFDHPCPGGGTDTDSDSDTDLSDDGDCMVNIHWRFEGSGPTEFMIHRYHGNNIFVNNLSSAQDSTDPTTNNNPDVGVFGNGVECSFAWQDHSGPYYLMVRDTRAISTGNPTGGFWEYSTDQRYSVCVEVVADGCLDPCCMFANGCGVSLSPTGECS